MQALQIIFATGNDNLNGGGNPLDNCDVTIALRAGKPDGPRFSSMISLAHSLGLTVVAEGVETDEQAATLQRLHCDELQDYLIGHPLTRNEMAELLLRTSRGIAGTDHV